MDQIGSVDLEKNSQIPPNLLLYVNVVPFGVVTVEPSPPQTAFFEPGEPFPDGPLGVCEPPTAAAAEVDFRLINATGTATATMTTTRTATAISTQTAFRLCFGRTGASTSGAAASVFESRKLDAEGDDAA